MITCPNCQGKCSVEDGPARWTKCPMCNGTGNITPVLNDLPNLAVKFDEGKPQLDLLPFEALEEVAKVLMHGAKKYGKDNYLNGMAWSRPFAACLRHLFAWGRREDKDQESGLPHLAHAVASLLFLITYAKHDIGEDDRGPLL